MFFKKVDRVVLQEERRKGFDSGVEKMRELKNKEIKSLKNRYWKILSEKNEEIKNKDKRIRSIEKYASDLQEVISRLMSFSREIGVEQSVIFMENVRKKSITEKMTDEIESIERKFSKTFSRMSDEIEKYKLIDKFN